MLNNHREFKLEVPEETSKDKLKEQLLLLEGRREEILKLGPKPYNQEILDFYSSKNPIMRDHDVCVDLPGCDYDTVMENYRNYENSINLDMINEEIENIHKKILEFKE